MQTFNLNEYGLMDIVLYFRLLFIALLFILLLK